MGCITLRTANPLDLTPCGALPTQFDAWQPAAGTCLHVSLRMLPHPRLMVQWDDKIHNVVEPFWILVEDSDSGALQPQLLGAGMRRLTGRVWRRKVASACLSRL